MTHHTRAARIRSAAVIFAALVISGCGGGPTAPQTATDDTAPEAPVPAMSVDVGTAGMSLTLNGKPWWPIGLNAYQLATDWAINVGCGAEVDLDEYFSRLPPLSLTRFNAYLDFAVDRSTGALNFAALDAVFAAAERHNQLLLPVLTGDEGGREDGYNKDYGWYSGAWRTRIPQNAPMTFAAWLDTAVKRWGDSPTVVGWSPVGEPEPAICRTPSCDWREHICPPGAAATLRQFFDDVGAQVRALKPGALIWSGRAGGGQCGTRGEEYEMISASPGIDVLEYHDYEPADSLPGDPIDGLAHRIEQARSVNKPLVVAEINETAGSCHSLISRAETIGRAVDAQRSAGTAGALLWAFVPDPRTAECTYDIGPADPLMALVGSR